MNRLIKRAPRNPHESTIVLKTATAASLSNIRSDTICGLQSS